MEQSSTMFCQHSHEAVRNYTNSVTLPYVIERNAFVPWLAMEEMFLYTSKNFGSAVGEKICSVNLDHETTFLTLAMGDPHLSWRFAVAL